MAKIRTLAYRETASVQIGQYAYVKPEIELSVSIEAGEDLEVVSASLKKKVRDLLDDAVTEIRGANPYRG